MGGLRVLSLGKEVLNFPQTPHEASATVYTKAWETAQSSAGCLGSCRSRAIFSVIRPGSNRLPGMWGVQLRRVL